MHLIIPVLTGQNRPVQFQLANSSFECGNVYGLYAASEKILKKLLDDVFRQHGGVSYLSWEALSKSSLYEHLRHNQVRNTFLVLLPGNLQCDFLQQLQQSCREYGKTFFIACTGYHPLTMLCNTIYLFDEDIFQCQIEKENFQFFRPLLENVFQPSPDS